LDAGNSRIGLGTASPTAKLHLPAGTATASTAPLKFKTGVRMTTDEAGAVEFETDDLYFTVTTGAGSGFASAYPPGYSSTYVKTTTEVAGKEGYKAFDPSTSLIGGYAGWSTTAASSQRVNVDLGSAKIIERIYYENCHTTGTQTTYGAKNYTFWGSNDASAFADTTYATDTNWTQLTVDDSQFDQHASVNAPDPKYVNVTNSTSYRYYSIKVADTWGGATFLNIRRIELQVNNGSARKKVVFANPTNGLTSGKIPVATTNGRLTDLTPQTELTDELTTITCTAPGTPDYAIADLTTTSPYGFASADEGQTVLKVIANLQTRVNELEAKLTTFGLLADAD
jgi:hypothetical protein